jgi:hypothetical protein
MPKRRATAAVERVVAELGFGVVWEGGPPSVIEEVENIG